MNLTISPLNMRVILRDNLLIFKVEWTIRIPLADCVISQQAKVQVTSVVHNHSIGLKSSTQERRKKDLINSINFAIVWWP
jgi:hypothetical protein